MIKYLLIALLVAPGVRAADWKGKTSFKIEAWYKFDETTIRFDGELWEDPVSARIEIGYELNPNVSFGLSHHSQWRTGFPMNRNDENEYYKTEIFIDYKFTLGDLFK